MRQLPLSAPFPGLFGIRHAARNRFSSPAGRSLNGDRVSQLDAGLGALSISRRSGWGRGAFPPDGVGLLVGRFVAEVFSPCAVDVVFLNFSVSADEPLGAGDVEVDALELDGASFR